MSDEHFTPRVAEWLLRACAGADDKQWIVDDLDDEMQARAVTHGVRRARWWYRRQVAASIAPLIARRIEAGFRHRSRGGEGMWQELLADVRYGIRVSLRTPLASAAVILTMVLCIGVTTAVFSVVDAVIIRPLPFEHSERTVQLFGINEGREIASLAYADLNDFRRTVPAIELLGVVRRTGGTYVGRTEAQQIRIAEVDSEFMQVLSLRPGFGRLFSADEYATGGAPAVVLMNAFWMREFGGDRSIIGKPIQIGTTMRTVIGVLPPLRFIYPTGQLDAIAPLRLSPEERTGRGIMWLESIARLKKGATVEQARAGVLATAKQIAASYPDAAGSRSANVKLLQDAVVNAATQTTAGGALGSVRRMLTLLSLAVAAVMLTACINVGNLLLARAATRTREFAVRAALGGSAWRVRRQVLTETLMLAFVGGVLGVALASPLTRALVSLYPGELPRAAEVRMNVSVVLVAITLTLFAALIASVPTLRRASARGLTEQLRTGGVGLASRRVEGVLIASQMAATLALVFAAALMVKTFISIVSVNPGFDPLGTLAFLSSPSSAKHPGRIGAVEYYENVYRALRAVPGVTAVTTTSHVPFAPGSSTDWFIRDDIGDQGKANPTTGITIAEQGFERAVRLTLLEGRGFTTADDSAAPRVLLINESLAKQAFAGVDPVGKTVTWSKEKWRIIGVLADARDKNLTDPAPPMIYAHYPQRNSLTRWIVVRTSAADAATLVPAIRSAMRSVDPTVPMAYVATLDQRIADSVAGHRFRAWLVASLGILASALALLGIYAIMSQAVARRTREIGIRIALGQRVESVQAHIIADAVRVASIGSIVGVALSIAAGKSLSSFLYAVNAHDPVLLGGAAVVLLVCCALASFIPARRASRVDPVVALRSE